mgnify:CR=1 FL=1
MNIIVRGSKIDLTPPIKTFVEQKLTTLEKNIPIRARSTAECRVEIGRPSRHHRSGPVYYAEVNLAIGSKLYRAVSEHEDVRAAIDVVRDDVVRQLRREKTKRESARRTVARN